MIYILLSLIVLVVQGILGMAGWWVLGSNFVLAAMLVGAVSWTLNAQDNDGARCSFSYVRAGQ